MKRLAATAITLMMTAAIGTAAASPYDHADSRPGASYGYDRGAGNHDNSGSHGSGSYNGYGEGRRTDYRNHDGRGYGDTYRYSGGHYNDRYNRGYGSSYYGNRGYRGGVSVAFVSGAAPYYYDDYNYGNYSYDNGYDACGPRVVYGPVRYEGRYYRDNTGDKLLGAVIGGAIGNQLGKGDGRKATTIAGALIGYSIAASADHDRRYDRYYNRPYESGYYGDPCWNY